MSKAKVKQAKRKTVEQLKVEMEGLSRKCRILERALIQAVGDRAIDQFGKRDMPYEQNYLNALTAIAGGNVRAEELMAEKQVKPDLKLIPKEEVKDGK